MIQRIEVNDFRCLHDIDINLGKRLTIISGPNGTGKSTLLALLGHCAEFKVKDGKTITGKQFRTEFGEIIKSSKFDEVNKSGFAAIHFCSLADFDTETDILKYRTTLQKSKRINKKAKEENDKYIFYDRFRIIPVRKMEGGKNSSAKVDWPSYYIGLSRLYPIGETNDETLKEKCIDLNQAEYTWFIDKYKVILDMNSINFDKEITTISSTDVKGKITVGIGTDRNDAKTISAGQDNLGQILLVMLSFKRLKSKNSENWEGGMLLIDELDATLHTNAQNRLIDELYRFSCDTDVQVVFTTHSLSLLEYVHNKLITNKDYKLLYLTHSNNKSAVYDDLPLEAIYSDLSDKEFAKLRRKKITVYTEDQETIWFASNLLKPLDKTFDFVNLSMSCDYLLKLIESDKKNFMDKLVILDGDVTEDKFKNLPNVITLPGDVRPEEIFWNYMRQIIENDHETSDMLFRNFNITLKSLDSRSPLLQQYRLKGTYIDKDWIEKNVSKLNNMCTFWKNCCDFESQDEKDQWLKEYVPVLELWYAELQDIKSKKFPRMEREKFKQWFNDNKDAIEYIYPLWEKDHQSSVDAFRKNALNIYNRIADFKMIPKVDQNIFKK